MHTARPSGRSDMSGRADRGPPAAAAGAGTRHRVGDGARLRARAATVEVTSRSTAGAAEKLRWYLEDYAPASPSSPARRGDRGRAPAARLGKDLFRAVFRGDDARDLWAMAKLVGLDGLRVEIDADPADVPGLPWELLREPNGPPLVVAAGQFVRTHHQAALTRLPTAGERPACGCSW